MAKKKIVEEVDAEVVEKIKAHELEIMKRIVEKESQ